MSDLHSQLKMFTKNSLRPVETHVTTGDGKQFVEQCRDERGVRSVVQQDSETLGFCPDLEPDLGVGRALDWLLVGSQDVGHDLKTLHQLRVTHILNVAWGVPNAFPDDFTYLTVPMYDDPSETFKTHYTKCREFITKARADGGTVLVHCNAGISRSASVVLAYVMEREKIPLEAAYDRLKQSRPAIQPNPGFMSQLAEFQEQLKINPPS